MRHTSEVYRVMVLRQGRKPVTLDLSDDYYDNNLEDAEEFAAAMVEVLPERLDPIVWVEHAVFTTEGIG